MLMVRLRPFALAHNLENFLWTPVLPCKVENWTLSPLHEKLIKTCAKFVQHSGYVTLQMAEVTIPRIMFAAILQKIDRIRICAGTGQCVHILKKSRTVE